VNDSGSRQWILFSQQRESLSVHPSPMRTSSKPLAPNAPHLMMVHLQSLSVSSNPVILIVISHLQVQHSMLLSDFQVSVLRTPLRRLPSAPYQASGKLSCSSLPIFSALTSSSKLTSLSSSQFPCSYASATNTSLTGRMRTRSHVHLVTFKTCHALRPQECSLKLPNSIPMRVVFHRFKSVDHSKDA